MKNEIATFETGTYNKPCEFFKEIMIGSVLCVGHSEIQSIKPCIYCKGYKEENTYYLPILDEKIKIVSEVFCNRPGAQQNLF